MDQHDSECTILPPNPALPTIASFFTMWVCQFISEALKEKSREILRNFSFE
jgi:hypothetical protein